MSTIVADKPLTARQQEVLREFTRLTRERGGVPPTVRDLASSLGCTSPNAMMYPLRALVKAGELIAGPVNFPHRFRLAKGCCPTCGRQYDGAKS